jgi:hypothetical protein
VTDALAEVVATFRSRLFLPDISGLLIVLATIAANRQDGDPVWTLLVAPPGGGKSELLNAVDELPDVHPAATITEAALLSGTPAKDQEQGAKGGLLRTIGDFGIVLCKDFGSILNMSRDARAATLAALREIYDGSWTRHVGTGGGRTLHWSGKVGLLGGATPTIDRHHTVMASMGERLVLFRLPEIDNAELARRALAHAGREAEMRAELASAVSRLFAAGLPSAPAPRSAEDDERLVSLATLVVRARSAVERDGYTREVELIPGSEAPTRLVVVLARLLGGLDAIGTARSASWHVVTKAALDSIPAIRRDVIHALDAAASALDTTMIAEAVSYPTQTTRRALEDLAAHGIATRHAAGRGKADSWTLTPFARTHYTAATGGVPEKADPFYYPNLTYDDIPGKVAPARNGTAPCNGARESSRAGSRGSEARSA